MPADLKRIYDHPANVLASVEPDYGNAIAYLRYYEDTNGVTFAALDNDALAAVREEYAQVRDLAKDINYFGAQALADAISSLLGLDDE